MTPCYDQAEDAFIDLQEKVLGAYQAVAEFSSGRYKIVRDYSRDFLSVTDLKAEENADKEEVRKTTAFKQLLVYDDRYSGETFKIEINSYKKDSWETNNDVLVYVLITQFDMKEKDAEILVKNINN